MNERDEQMPVQELRLEQGRTQQARAGRFLKRWGPALLIMAMIFAFSSIPSEKMPTLGAFDLSVKKLGHATGYALLALAYLRGLGEDRPGAYLLAWLMAALYAVSDEFHQSFVAGRSAAWMDVGIDAVGAAVGLWLGKRWRRKAEG